jgi:hypothetical protein
MAAALLKTPRSTRDGRVLLDLTRSELFNYLFRYWKAQSMYHANAAAPSGSKR